MKVEICVLVALLSLALCACSVEEKEDICRGTRRIDAEPISANRQRLFKYKAATLPFCKYILRLFVPMI